MYVHDKNRTSYEKYQQLKREAVTHKLSTYKAAVIVEKAVNVILNDVSLKCNEI